MMQPTHQQQLSQLSAAIDRLSEVARTLETLARTTTSSNVVAARLALHGKFVRSASYQLLDLYQGERHIGSPAPAAANGGWQ